MAITNVKVSLNGTWHNLTYNSSTAKWEANITAPGTTSFKQANGHYPMEVVATNTAGTTATVDTTNPSFGNALKLVVKEKIPPVITVSSPTNGAYVSNNQQPIAFKIVDEVGGSGVNQGSITVKLDGAILSVTKTVISNGFSCSVVPSVMADGSHTVVINGADNDGNNAVQKTITFTVDTVPPTLNVTNPVEGLVTATPTLTVTGTTNDVTSSPVSLTMVLNGVSSTVTVNSDGSFSKALTLKEGGNTIKITATDKSGKTSTVNRNVVLDTTVPNITSLAVNPNPADAGATVIISVVVE